MDSHYKIVGLSACLLEVDEKRRETHWGAAGSSSSRLSSPLYVILILALQNSGKGSCS
jgi:hypothetical protein